MGPHYPIVHRLPTVPSKGAPLRAGIGAISAANPCFIFLDGVTLPEQI
jgi:hypothetical protein